ncbi:MAG: hypothetical protein A3B25_00815 [Candidatus Ryanbacteria bacterium RIFCSPLOWO2_01_FULL_48_26]|uniref:phosphomannomutase n=1 Tax=Candidatus Ryanbacteria bacterium RIFCSPLOWO2_01_FULL_48_26 TaxID=1802126 RepID=A0A1G2GRA3_9BACT|nr:MAG: hypothetical protein A3B25_00815 [Candidatus Ryanbacteria bacterium RIFCSPLOWO2_01_FULL_48_26]
MKKLSQKIFAGKELFVFDLDGTLAPSKSIADFEMIKLLLRLLEKKRVAVIGGGKYELFKEQLIQRLPRKDERLERFFLFPTSSTAFYRFRRGKWICVYSHGLSARERKKIKTAFIAAFKEIAYEPPARTYGPVIEDRGTQITFSALGQEIIRELGVRRGLALKEEWNKRHDIRPELMKALKRLLPTFEVRQGGLSSVDVTRKGIDKAYGIRRIEKTLGVSKKKMLFVGDAIFPGGNDYAVVRAGVDYVRVDNPEDTKQVIRMALKD